MTNTKYRDRINHLLRIRKNNYYNNYITTAKQNSKQLWKGRNEIISKTKTCAKNINLCENKQFIFNQEQAANKFNIFFTKIGPKLSERR